MLRTAGSSCHQPMPATLEPKGAPLWCPTRLSFLCRIAAQGPTALHTACLTTQVSASLPPAAVHSAAARRPDLLQACPMGASAAALASTHPPAAACQAHPPTPSYQPHPPWLQLPLARWTPPPATGPSPQQTRLAPLVRAGCKDDMRMGSHSCFALHTHCWLRRRVQALMAARHTSPTAATSQ